MSEQKADLGVATDKANQIWNDLIPVIGFVLVYNVMRRVSFNETWASKDTALYWATGVLILATMWTVLGYVRRKQPVPLFLVFSAGIVGTFGLLGIILQEKSFLYIKPTIQQLVLGGMILGSVAIGKNLWRVMFQRVFDMPEYAWRTLAIRWGLFFIVMAAWNEFVWRYFAPGFEQPLHFAGILVAPAGSYDFLGLTFGSRDAEDVWANWKLGNMVITFIFGALNTPYMLKHIKPESMSKN
ncbi:MAG: intracellular septation protein A [Alphaproteobacteria bacterium]|nr:intracellular septation protein A [Alphaproteobacteria bacterium]